MRHRRQGVPWLLAGALAAGAAALALLGPGISWRNSADDSEATAGPTVRPETPDAGQLSTGPQDLVARSEEPQGLGAHLLGDSDGTRRNLLARTIREAGYDCPEVRTADPVAPGGHAWRAYCGDLLLYWVDIDEFGRMSVQPGAYNDSGFGPDAGSGGRTLTIQPEEFDPLREVR